MVTDEMVEKAARCIDPDAFAILDGGDQWRIINSHHQREATKIKVRAALEAALSAAEPVMYVSRNGSSCSPAFYESLVDRSRKNWQPLFAAPPALSAQVQDVAGWQPIETAPKDGSTFLAVMAKAYSPRATLCKFEDGKFLSPSQGEKFVLPGWNQWWPTHWMPLPAAPAKQEGKGE